MNSFCFPPGIVGFGTGNDVVWCMFASVLYRHGIEEGLERWREVFDLTSLYNAVRNRVGGECLKFQKGALV